MSSVPDSVVVEVTVAATADEAWDALRDSARTAQWFGWDAETLEGEIAYIFQDHATADDAGRVLRFSGVPDRYEVEDIGEGRSAVRLIRAGKQRSQSEWGAFYDDMIQGWITFTHQLALYLDRHRTGQRRTIYLTGQANDPQTLPPSAAMALESIRSAAPGSRYAVEAAGEQLTGEVRFATALQTGLTVEGWGDGLLVLVDRPSAEGQPAAGWAVLTTYGLSDDAFHALETRWKAWWTARYPDERPGCVEFPDG